MSAEQQRLNLRSVAVIGAGVSGVAAGVHLRRAGLDVTVFERSRRAGGIWVYDENTSKDASFPSTLPSVGDSPEYERVVARCRKSGRQDSPMRDLDGTEGKGRSVEQDVRSSFAPPGPCYVALKNNVSTIEMEMACQRWKPETEEFVPHHVMADYIQDAAIDNGVVELISFDTRVNAVKKVDHRWRVESAKLIENDDGVHVVESVKDFDALVIATGHYHACNVPDIPGLADWKTHFPTSITHSKIYRKPDEFRDQNVLLIGSGVSSMDIARDLGQFARSVYQSSRGGPYDLPSHLLLDNGARVSGIRSFDPLDSDHLAPDGSIPGTITLQNGLKLCNIHRIIVCTGYHVSFPFMPNFHADGVRPENADEHCLVTDGQQTHNLHKDIWYIPDPTMAFIGVPYHVATFSCFEFQAMALAAVFSGQVPLPSEVEMRKEYVERIERKGAGRNAHSLKGFGEEIGYVDDLRDCVNGSDAKRDVLMDGHTQRWHEAYLRRVEKGKVLFGKIREEGLDQRVIDLIQGC